MSASEYSLPQDHDQRFKTLIKEFLPELFALFWPDLAVLFDFSGVEWLDTEVFPDPPQGERRSLDLVARLPLAAPIEIAPGEQVESLVSIIHIEIESADSVRAFRRRMFLYYAHLRQRHTVPILPLAIFLRVAMDGLGEDRYEEHFGPFYVLQYNYLYVGLPGLEAFDFVERDNPLAPALAALMRARREQRPELKAQALRQVVRFDINDFQRFLLAECVQAYLPLPEPDQQSRFNSLLQDESYSEVQQMATTWFEQGIEKGIEQGIEKGIQKGMEQGIQKGMEQGIQRGMEQGQRDLVRGLLERRFGPLTQETLNRIANYPAERLIDLADRIGHCQSLDEVWRDSP